MSESNSQLQEKLEEKARELGFCAFGIAPPPHFGHRLDASVELVGSEEVAIWGAFSKFGDYKFLPGSAIKFDMTLWTTASISRIWRFLWFWTPGSAA